MEGAGRNTPEGFGEAAVRCLEQAVRCLEQAVRCLEQRARRTQRGSEQRWTMELGHGNHETRKGERVPSARSLSALTAVGGTSAACAVVTGGGARGGALPRRYFRRSHSTRG